MTAHRCVFADGPVDGQTLVITGGVGRVGYYAVVNHCDADWAAQVIAANGGARVDRIIDVEFGANLPAVPDMIHHSCSRHLRASIS